MSDFITLNFGGISMAKIPVEKKDRQPSWIWWLLGLLLLGGLIWILVEALDDEEDLDVTDVEAVEPFPPATPEVDEVDLGAILANPDDYIGEPFPTSQVTVRSVPTDRGFWIADDGDSLFAIIIDAPEEQPTDINPDQTIQIDGGMLHDSSYLPDLPGSPLDADTETMAEEQPIFLVVDEQYITIQEEGTPQPGTDPAQTGP